MNFHAPFPDPGLEWRGAAPAVALASFDRAPSTGQQRARFRAAGITGVLAVHGLVLCATYFLGSSFVAPTRQHTLTVVNIEPEFEKTLPPPPLPNVAPPAAYVPVQIMPEIELI